MRRKIILMFFCFVFFITNSTTICATEAVHTPAPVSAVVTNPGAVIIPPTTGEKNKDGTSEVAGVNLYSILRGAYSNGKGNSLEQIEKYIVLDKKNNITQEKLDELKAKASNSKNEGAKEALQELRKLYKKYENYDGVEFTSKEIEGINESESIADGEMYAQDKGETQGVKENNGPGPVEEQVSELVRSVSTSVNDILSYCDATLDNLIYGRLIRYGTNYFCFELVKGNPYGIAGAYVYAVLRNLCFAAMALMAGWQFAKASMGNGSGEERRRFKETIYNTVIIILFLLYMPRIVDILIAFKDIILHYFLGTFEKDLTEMFSGVEDGSIIGYYKASAENSKLLFDALLYLAASGISIWYAFTYIMTAVSVMVLFVFVPFALVMSYMDNKLIGQWFKMVIGDIFAPVIDCVLLMVPVFVRQLCSGNEIKGYLVSLGVCYAIIPCRALIKQMMGISGGLRSELMGFGAMMAAGRLMGNVANRMRNTKDGIVEAIKNGKQDREKAEMYEELAAASGEHGGSAALPELNSVVGGKEPLSLSKEEQPLEALDSTVVRNTGQNGTEEGMEDGMALEAVTENADGNLPELDSTIDGINGMEEMEGAGYGAPEELANEQALDAVETGAEGVPNGDGPDGEFVQQHPDIDREAAAKALDDGQYASAVDAINKNNILKKHANIDNFENPEFKNAFNFSERAQMYRKRANRRLAGGLAQNIGGFAGGLAGGAAFATLAGGATMMAGPSTNLMAMASAGSIGLSVGSTAGSVAGTLSAESAGKIRAAGTALNTMYNNAQEVRNGNADYTAGQILKNGSAAYVQARRNQTGLEFSPDRTVPVPHSLNSYGNVHGISPAAMAARQEMDYNREMAARAEQAQGSAMNQPHRTFEVPVQDYSQADYTADYEMPAASEYVAPPAGTDFTETYENAFSSLGFSQEEMAPYQQAIDAFSSMDSGSLTEEWQRELYNTVDAEVNSFMLNEQNAPENWMENPELLEVAQRQRAVIAGNEMSRILRRAVSAKTAQNGGKLSSAEEIRQFSNTMKALEDSIKQELFSRSWKK